MKAKALIKFKDVKNDLVIEKGSVFEVTKKRFDEFNSNSWGVIVEEVDTKEMAKNE